MQKLAVKIQLSLLLLPLLLFLLSLQIKTLIDQKTQKSNNYTLLG